MTNGLFQADEPDRQPICWATSFIQYLLTKKETNMRLTIWGRISLLITFYAISWQAWSQPGLQEKYLWRSGQAAVDITPVGSLWMAGYAARNKPAHEKMHSLWVKAVALEDQQKNLGVIISSDLVGIPKEVSDQIRNKLQEKYGIAKAQIMMNSSHTHSGPYMFDSFRPSSFSMPETEIEKVKKYTAKLIDDIVEVASSAINKLEPARVFSGNGTSRFQVNRRNNDEKTLSLYADLNGPNDYAVPVLKIEDTSGEIKGIVFGYACHATVLNGYLWSGDYPGFAQIELNKIYPNATVMFMQGCGGDQNPLPRRIESLAQQYGKTLAASVEQVLEDPMTPLASDLSVNYQEINLQLSTPPTRQQLEDFKEENENIYFDAWADFMLEKLNKGETLITSYPYPVQLWTVGSQNIVSLGGETVVEYSIRIKEFLGRDTFVFGYSNDGNCAYIPSARVLEEGGYEGKTSQYYKGFPSTWSASIEIDILNAVMGLARKQHVPIKGGSLTSGE